MNPGKKWALISLGLFLAGVVVVLDQAARADLREQLEASNCEIAPCIALKSTAPGLSRQIELDKEYGIVAVRRLERLDSGFYGVSARAIFQTRRRDKFFRETWDLDHETATAGQLEPITEMTVAPPEGASSDEPKAGIYAPPSKSD